MNCKAFVLSLLISVSFFFSLTAQSPDGGQGGSAEEQIDRMPKIHGVFRGRYEGEWDDAFDDGYRQRFQVRNARVSLEGQLLKPLDWFMRVDLCDKGKMKFLDAWARWKFNQEWALKLGQYRVPFGVDAFRAPGTYIFANRSFIGKQMANLRQVGLQIGYYGKMIPLSVETGVFNSAPMADHDVWQKGMDYAIKATVAPAPYINISAGFLSMMPYGARMNLADVAVNGEYAAVQWGLEYQHLHYVDVRFADVNAWLVWFNWAHQVKWGYFNCWNLNCRFDGMTNHSNGKPAEDGRLINNDPTRNRLTLGSSIVCNVGKVKTEVMLNYEKYFFHSEVVAPVGESDKILAELIVKF